MKRITLIYALVLFSLVLSEVALPVQAQTSDDSDPFIIQPDTQSTIEIPEGGTQNFTITPRYTNIITHYKWYVDASLVAIEINRYSYRPDFESSGRHVIKVQACDASGGQISYNWSVVVNNFNRKPTLRITTPQNNTQFDPGKEIDLIAEISDPDGDSVTVEWYENGVLLHRGFFNNGSGIDYWRLRFKAGATHAIEVKVNDSKGLVDWSYLTIVVGPYGPHDPNWELICGSFSIIILFSPILWIAYIILTGNLLWM